MLKLEFTDTILCTSCQTQLLTMSLLLWGHTPLPFQNVSAPAPALCSPSLKDACSSQVGLHHGEQDMYAAPPITY